MEIKTEEQLLEEAKKYREILVFGKGSLVNILCRFFKGQGISVRAASYVENPKINRDFGDVPLVTVKELEQIATEDCLVMVVAGLKEQMNNKIEKKLSMFHFDNIAYLDYEMMSDIGRKEHVPMDFICVGFVKCGTSSIHEALRRNSDVILPKKKETLYAWWREKFEDAPDRFNKIYFPHYKEGKSVGNIEPSYHAKADGIYECYGKDIKIIFMVRNPADALYSYFKMLMRKADSIHQVNYYRKYFKFNLKMFDDYIRDYVEPGKVRRFEYIKWIKEYERYFGKDNIKVVFFEELIKDPEHVMNDLQEFAGVKPMEFKSLPHTNEGKEVSKNYIAALINMYLYRQDIALRSERSKEKKQKHEKWKKFWHKHTLVDNRDKMLESTRQYLSEYYAPSIKELEEFCGKSLEGIWY